MSKRPIKICIVSVHAYPVINPQAEGSFGGIETRSWCFAREIARLPLTDVTFVVTHRSAPRRSIMDRVDVLEATNRIEWLHQDLSNARQLWRKERRILWSQLPTLGVELLAWIVTRPFRNPYHRRWQIPSNWLTQVDADVYIAFGVNSQSDWTLISADSIRRPFVLCLASEFDVDQRFLDQSDFANQYGVTSTLARHLIGHSDRIVVQNSFQQEQLKRVWNRDSVRIDNPLDLLQWDADRQIPLPKEVPREPYVLWVGRADRFHKRPLEMLHPIRANPQIQFVMVMNPSDADVETEIRRACLSNLTMIPQLPFRQMSSLMNSACVFASTSSASHEGLPNVFLQAAASRVPIVSLETSAEWLAASGSGVCVQGDIEAFNETLARFVTQRGSAEIREFGQSGRYYVEREHDSVRQATKLFNNLQEIVNSHQPTSAELPGESMRASGLNEDNDHRRRRIALFGAPSSFVTHFFAELLTQAGLHVDVVTWEPGTNAELIPGVPIVRVEMPRRQFRNVVLRALRWIQRVFQNWSLKRFKERTGKDRIEDWGQDIIYPYLMRGQLVRAAKQCRSELVIGLEASSYGLATARFPGPRVIVPFGGDIFCSAETWPFAGRLISRALQQATLVTPASFAALEHLQKRFGLNKDQIAPLIAGLPLDEYVRPSGEKMLELRKKWGLPPNAVIVANCRRFRPAWGGETVRQVFEELARQQPEVHFVLMRGGDEADELIARTRSEVQAEGCESQFTFLQRDLTAQEYREFATLSDIFVSLMGLGDLRSKSVMEFAAGGSVPVIARQREYELMQHDGFAAVLTPPGDIAATVQAILPLINGADLRQSIREKNAIYLQKFEDLMRNRPEIVKLYTQLLPQRT